MAGARRLGRSRPARTRAPCRPCGRGRTDPSRIERAPPGRRPEAVVTSIAIALFDGVEELDVAGPWEVLSWWAREWPEDEVEVFTVADSTDAITCAKGMRMLPDRTWQDAGSIDVLVYPGGRGTRPQLGDQRIRERIRELAARGTLMTSVCTGALVYADAGLLDGRPATTHWSSLDLLRTLGADIDVL